MADVPAETRPPVAGVVDGKSNPPKILSGAGFSVKRTDTGQYYITFNKAFDNLWGVSAIVIRSPGLTSTLDGAQLKDVDNLGLFVTTGNASGGFNDQVFSFIVVGK